MRNQIQNVSKPLSLYEMVEEHRQLLAQLFDHETGEVNELIQKKINALEPDIEKKCIAVGQWIKTKEKEKREIEWMKEQIVAREKAYDKEITKWQDYLKRNMESQGITKIASPYFSLQIKKNPPSTTIIDADKIPNQYMKTREIVKVEVTPDKNAIKEEVLRTGVQIEGAIVAQTTKLVISTDKI